MWWRAKVGAPPGAPARTSRCFPKGTPAYTREVAVRRRPVRGRGDVAGVPAALLRLSVGSVIESVVRCRRRTEPVRAWSTNRATPACPRSHRRHGTRVSRADRRSAARQGGRRGLRRLCGPARQPKHRCRVKLLAVSLLVGPGVPFGRPT